MKPNVKKIFLVLFILLCIGAIGYGGYLIYDNIDKAPPQTERTTKPDDGQGASLRTRLVYLEDSGFELCVQDSALILIHKDVETKMDWTGSFRADTVQMNYADYNGDGQNELAIVITKENDGAITNELHILTVQINGTDVRYRDTSFVGNSVKWNGDIQLEAVQTADQRRVEIKWGDKAAYFRVPDKSEGGYYLFSQFNYGNSVFSLTPGSNEIQLQVELNAVFDGYKEPCVPGTLKAKLTHNGAQYIFTELHFTVAEAWGILPPLAENPTPFALKAHNSAPKVSTDRILTEIEFTLEGDSISRHDFSQSQSDEVYLTDIMVTEQFIKLVLPKVMSFNDILIKDYPPTVWLGGENGYYIQGRTELKEEDGSFCLYTYFAQPIGRSDFTKLVYHFGA